MRDRSSIELELLYENMLLMEDRCIRCGNPDYHRSQNLDKPPPECPGNLPGEHGPCIFKNKDIINIQKEYNKLKLNIGDNLPQILNQLKGYAIVDNPHHVKVKTYFYRGEQAIIWSPLCRFPFIIDANDEIIENIEESLVDYQHNEIGHDYVPKTKFVIRKDITNINVCYLYEFINKQEIWPKIVKVYGKPFELNAYSAMIKHLEEPEKGMEVHVDGKTETNPLRVMEPLEHVTYTINKQKKTLSIPEG
jgi:hypothetical protein